ncbi:MAG: right-handed parallel beta-helix repeat-containing protein [Candidatus Bathyarchaeia archaeon]
MNMFKRACFTRPTLLAVALLSFLLMFPQLTYVSSSNDKNIIVVPDDTPSINMAVSMVSEGGLIRVRRGVYTEEVYINKSITLMGEEGARILAPLKVLNACNIVIGGIDIEIYPAGTEIGMALLGASELRIENLSIVGTGVLMVNSTGIVVRNCTFTENPGPAIQIRGSKSKNILVENCIFNRTYMALSAQSGSNITFRYNTVYAKHLSIKLYSATSNITIYLNNMMSGDAEDHGKNNRWYNETLKLGNLWGDLSPEGDRDGDGRIDEPKTIGGTAGSRDEYPLAKPFTEYLKDISGDGQMSNPNNPAIPIILAVIALVAASAILIAARKHMRRKGI